MVDGDWKEAVKGENVMLQRERANTGVDHAVVDRGQERGRDLEHDRARGVLRLAADVREAVLGRVRRERGAAEGDVLERAERLRLRHDLALLRVGLRGRRPRAVPCLTLVTDLEGHAVRELVAHEHAPRDELEVGLAAELAGLDSALTVARARAAVTVGAPVLALLAVEVGLAREGRAVLGVRAGADAHRVVLLLRGAVRAHGVRGLAVVDGVARRADGVGRELARGVLPLALLALGAEG